MKNLKKEKRPLGITVPGLLMIIFGLAEIVTSFTHHFFGIYTAEATAYTIVAAAIGAFYVAAGLLVLTMKKRAAALAIVLLGADIAGRIALVAVGWYPVDTLLQTIAIVTGTAIAAAFAIYIALQWNSFG
jgi:hypothetical protein